MNIPRPDTASMILAAVTVVGIVVLALFHIAAPDVLSYVAVGALGISGGTALNQPAATDSTAKRIADSLASLEQLLGAVRRSPAPAPARPAPPATGIPTQPSPSSTSGVAA